MYRHYYTLPELFIPEVGETIDDFKDPLWAKTKDKGFYTIINHISGLSFTQDDAYTKELMQKYVWPEMWDAKVIYLGDIFNRGFINIDFHFVFLSAGIYASRRGLWVV